MKSTNKYHRLYYYILCGDKKFKSRLSKSNISTEHLYMATIKHKGKYGNLIRSIIIDIQNKKKKK